MLEYILFRTKKKDGLPCHRPAAKSQMHGVTGICLHGARVERGYVLNRAQVRQLVVRLSKIKGMGGVCLMLLEGVGFLFKSYKNHHAAAHLDSRLSQTTYSNACAPA